MHIVHLNSDPNYDDNDDVNQLAVIGILFEEGEENPFLTPITDWLASGGGQITNADGTLTGVTLDVTSVFPESKIYYTYPGSLTTPNCRETVTWHVMQEVMQASGAQIQLLRQPFSYFGNARALQLLGSRTIRTNEAPPPPPPVDDDDDDDDDDHDDDDRSRTTININFGGLLSGFNDNSDS